ncbi:MAG: FeoB-associated Cys-rich membrane protein [Clostridia bacterium]|nr:FeoB-associated Cys-rich membrane protein [Clostridia bacterium]
MIQAITENAGTIIVSLLLIAMITAIITHLLRNKKQGKSSCGCNCGSCPMSGSCHKQP